MTAEHIFAGRCLHKRDSSPTLMAHPSSSSVLDVAGLKHNHMSVGALERSKDQGWCRGPVLIDEGQHKGGQGRPSEGGLQLSDRMIRMQSRCRIPEPQSQLLGMFSGPVHSVSTYLAVVSRPSVKATKRMQRAASSPLLHLQADSWDSHADMACIKHARCNGPSN
jgi:hypothetical protein